MGNFLRKFFATVLMILFIGLFLVTNFSYAMYQTFFNANFYQGDLVKSARDFLIYGGQKYIDFQPIAEMDKGDFSAIMEKIITQDDLANAVDDVISQIVDLEIGSAGVVELNIPLSWLSQKSTVFSDSVTDYLFGHLPECAIDEQDFAKGFDCIPKGISKEDFAGVFKPALDRKLISDLPDHYNFQIKLPDQLEGKSLGAFFKELSDKVFLILASALLIILILIGLLVFSPKIAVMKWMAKTVFFASLIAVLLVMFLNVFVPVIFDKLLQSLDVNVLSYNAWMSVYILFIGAFTIKMLKIVFPLAILSLLFWIVGMIYDRNHKKINNYGSPETDTGYKELH